MCDSKRDSVSRTGIPMARWSCRLLGLLFVMTALAGCVPWELRAILDGPTGKALSLSPQSIIVPANGSITFAAVGGVPPYVYSIVSGGGTLDSASGVYTAPLVPGSAEIRVTDAAGKSASASASIQVFPGALAVTPAALSLMLGGSVTFTAIGGTPPYTFSLLTVGSGSPSLNTTTGFYVAGSSPGTDTIRVVDGAAAVVTATVTVTVLSSSVDYTIPSTSFPSTGTTASPIPGGSSFTLHNGGTGPGIQPVDWKIFLSTNSVIDGGDMMVASGTTAGLPAGASAVVSIAGAFPPVAAGAWYLIAQVSAADDTTPANNTSGAGALTLIPPNIDYTVSGVSSTGGTVSGSAMSGTLAVSNVGTAGGSAAVDWAVFASLDAVLDGTDYLVARGSTGALGALTGSGPIPFSGYWPSTPNTWQLIAVVSAADDIGSGNNTGTSAAVVVTGPPPANVDYSVVAVSNPGGTAGDPLSASFTASNIGTSPGALPVFWTAYLSSNSTLEIGTDPVLDSGSFASLAAGATSAPVTFAGRWPSAPGTWSLIVAVSASDDIATGNNVTASAAVATTAPDVDYAIQSLSSTGGTTAGSALAGALVIRNAGTHAGTQFIPWAVYLSADSVLNVGTDMLLATGSVAAPGLAAGASTAPLLFAGMWPGATTARTWYLIAAVGAGDDVNAADDVGSSAGVPVNPPNVDYTVLSVANMGGTTAGGPIVGSFTIQNMGTAAGSAPVAWIAYVSSDTILGVTDPVISTGSTATLPGGTTSGPIGFGGTWPAGTATWFLIVKVSASDDINGANDLWVSAGVPVTTVAPGYTITSVPLPAGSTTGQLVSGSITVQNLGAAPGSATVSWQVYASLGDAIYNTGDILLAAGSFAGLAVSGSTSPGWSGTWPATPGTYYIVVRVSAADAPAAPDAASAAIGVTSPPPPNYTISFDPALPWSGVVGMPIGATGTQLTIQNLSVNLGHANITWAVYLSTDGVLDATDLLVQQGSVAPLAGSASTPVTFAGSWPGIPAKTFTFIATVHAADDSNATNDVVPAPHVSVTGDYRYLEVEPNNGSGTNPPVGQTSDTLVTTLGANQTIVIEGSMDAYGVNGYDTYKFATILSTTKLSLRALWKTGFDDLDLFLWDTGTTNLSSQSTGIDSEPGASTFDVGSVTPRTCYVSAYMWLNGGTSGSVGKKYVITVTGLP